MIPTSPAQFQPEPLPALLLAAGNSSRMGRPKQLLDYQGQPLIRRATQTALAANFSPVIVVLGAFADQVRPALADLPVVILENLAWPRGMGTTLHVGVAHLLASSPVPDAALLMLSDQPLLTPGHLQQLVALRDRTQKSLVAAAYNETLGVPALIGRAHFAELQTLPDGAGAKALFVRHPDLVAGLPLSEAAVDIDDPAAYQELIQKYEI